MKFTHKVAVVAYIYIENKFLFLLRNTGPKIWALPGGHLLENENPKQGLIREIKEETNLDVKVIAPISTWFGEWRNNLLLSIDYYVIPMGGELKLSDEHCEYKWVSVNELKQNFPISLHPMLKLTAEDFAKAESMISTLNNFNNSKG